MKDVENNVTWWSVPSSIFRQNERIVLASTTGTGLGGTTIYGVTDVDVVQTDSYTLVLSLMRDGINSPIVDISDPSSPVNVADIPPAYVAIAPE